jgi:hypothetical protein
MRTQSRLGSLSVVLLITVAVSGCSCTPTFYESGPPRSRIVVKYDGHNRCALNTPTTKTLTTRNTRSSEASWSVGGKVGDEI